MRTGLQIPNFSIPRGPAGLRDFLKQVAQTADQGGIYSLWVMDHFFQIQNVGQPEEDMLESYTTLGYLAGLTEKIKLGTMVTGVIYRYPGLLVKTVSTLDVLSSGRAYLGIGAAWFEGEALGLGVPFPPIAERFELLEETLQVAHQMWGEKIEPFQGKHLSLARTLNHPQPLTKPHPPILIGGMGENKTMRLIAKYGDACNFFAGAGMDTLQEKLDMLKKRCEEAGRPYEDIEKTVLDTVDFSKQTVADFVERARALKSMGIQQYIFNCPQLHTDPTVIHKITTELVPALTAL